MKLSVYTMGVLCVLSAALIGKCVYASEENPAIVEAVQRICSDPLRYGQFHSVRIGRGEDLIFKYKMNAFILSSIDDEFSKKEMAVVRDLLDRYQNMDSTHVKDCVNELVPLIRRNAVVLDGYSLNFLNDSVTCNENLRIFRNPNLVGKAISEGEYGLLILYDWFKDYLSIENYFYKDVRSLKCRFIHSGHEIIHSTNTRVYDKNSDNCQQYFSSTNFIKVNGKRVLDQKAKFEFTAVSCMNPNNGEMNAFAEVLEVTQRYDGKIVQRLDPTKGTIDFYHPFIMRH